MSGAEKAVLVKIAGRVQRVGFRAWTENEARRLGLSGWVRNEPEGSVSVLIGGSEDAVGQMRKRLRKGPPSARVTSLVSEDADPAELPQGFHVTY